MKSLKNVNMNKIKLVVMNEHTLGYVFPEQPKYLHTLHSSILKGSTYPNDGQSIYIGTSDKIRLASLVDFNEFRVSMKGYNDTEYEFIA
jgi:hypothetical protein